MAENISVEDFSPHLFWDIDKSNFDFRLYKEQLVYRVVEYGMMKDWALIQKIFSPEELKSIVLNLRDLDKVTLSFLAHFFKTDKSAFRCYTQTQSPAGFWNS